MPPNPFIVPYPETREELRAAAQLHERIAEDYRTGKGSKSNRAPALAEKAEAEAREFLKRSKGER